MTSDELLSRLNQLLQNTGGRLPPNNGILMHLLDFRKLVMDMAKQNQGSAIRYLRPGQLKKPLYFQIGREKIQVKPSLAGLPLGTVALELT